MWDFIGDYKLSTTNVEIELRGPTLVNLTNLLWMERSCLNLAKIIVGMVSPYILAVVCVLLCLIGSFVAMHGCVTHALDRLVMQMSHT